MIPIQVFFETDFQNLDQTLLPGMLTLIFSLPMMFFDPNSPYYISASAFMTWAADDIACTLVKWIGADCRLIIGVMFSGLFGTSWGDTLYVQVAIRCFYFFIVRELKKRNQKDLLDKFLSHHRRGRVYGDNTLLALPKAVLRYFTDEYVDAKGIKWEFGLLHNYFAVQWGLTLKLSETYVHSGHNAFWTKIRDDYDVDEVKRTVITKRGPQYLKRFFIKVNYFGNIFAMPFRETKDYFVKSIISAKEINDHRIWLSRWVGLLIDSAGTNLTAWNYLAFLIRRFVERDCNIGDRDWLDWVNTVNEYSDPEYFVRQKKMGIKSAYGVVCPTRNQLFNKFVPTEYKNNHIEDPFA